MTRSNTWSAAVALLMAVSMVGGCSDDSGKGDFDAEVGEGPCLQDDAPDTCGQSCDGDSDCGSGFWCFENECTATCGSGGGCPVTHSCDTSRGKCIAKSGPCASDTPPDGCGDPCASNSDCPFSVDAPTVCRGSVCTAECFPTTHEFCDASEFCNHKGVCQEGQRPIDASVDADDCEPTTINPEPVTPTVVLIVDQSGSMDSDFGGTDRWSAAEDALVGPEGVVTQQQGGVRFGLVLYTSDNCANCSGCGCNAPAVEPCPMTRSTDPTFGGFATIDEIFNGSDPAEPEEDTPTGDTIDWVTNGYLPAFSDVNTDDDSNWTWDGEPIVYVLVTDGEPDMCANADPSGGADINDNGVPDAEEARQLVVDRTAEAFSHGIPTYVVRVAINSSHFDDVAVAGGTESAIPADDPDDLTSALAEIVTGELSCTIELEGRIADIDTVCEDSGNAVALGGTELTCGGRCDAGDTEGWCAVDQSHIELRGEACDTLKEGQSTLQATFQCDAFIGL